MKKDTLGDIISISKGKKHSTSNIPCASSKRIIGIVDLRNDNSLVYTDEKHGTEATTNDILIAWDGANAGTIGYGKKGYIGSTIARLRIKEPLKYYTPFIGMLLKTQFEYLRGSTTGATIPHVSRNALEKIKLPIISFDDQIRIATILTCAERLTAKRKECIKALDELLKSTFLEMFGDPVRNEKGWEKKPLNNLGSLDRGVSKHRPRNAPELLGGRYPLIQTGDVSNAGTYILKHTTSYSEIGLKQSKLWKAGTLCITIAANIAKTSILTFDACFPDSVVGFTADKNETHVLYVYHLFSFFQMILEKNAPQAAQKNINLDILRNLQIPKPPLPLQNQFAAIVEKVESIKAKQTQSLVELESLYGSLSQRAFKGELDLSRVPVVYVEAEPLETEETISADVKVTKAFSKDELINILEAKAVR